MEEKLFNQKNRRRALKITDVAISKVRMIKLYGFDNEQIKYIQEQHKRLLGISKIFNNSEEVGILINIITWENYVIIGTKNQVDIKSNEKAYNELMISGKNTLLFMHNHPSTSPFSGEDFKTFCLNDSLYIITVVGNDGSVQALVKLSDFEVSYALKYYMKLAFEKYRGRNNNATLAMGELLKNCEEIGLKYIHGGKLNV